MSKNKTFLISVAAAFMTNVIIFGAWFVIFSGITAEKNTIQNLRAENGKTEKKLKNARSLDVLLKNIGSKKEKITQAFLNSGNLVGIIEKLEFIGVKSGADLTIKSVKIPEQASSEKPEIGFQFEGSFNNIFGYLFLFENLPYKIDVSEFSLARRISEKEIIWQVNIRINLLSYENI